MLGGYKFGSDRSPRSCEMACAGDDIACVSGKAAAGSMVGAVVVNTDERSDVGGYRADAATGDCDEISRVATGVEEEC